MYSFKRPLHVYSRIFNQRNMTKLAFFFLLTLAEVFVLEFQP